MGYFLWENYGGKGLVRNEKGKKDNKPTVRSVPSKTLSHVNLLCLKIKYKLTFV